MKRDQEEEEMPPEYMYARLPTGMNEKKNKH